MHRGTSGRSERARIGVRVSACDAYQKCDKDGKHIDGLLLNEVVKKRGVPATGYCLSSFFDLLSGRPGF